MFMYLCVITGMPPPRMMRPPAGPPGMGPVSLPMPPGLAPISQQNPNVLSAPPSIMKLPQKVSLPVILCIVLDKKQRLHELKLESKLFIDSISCSDS